VTTVDEAPAGPAVEGGLSDLADEVVTWLETGVRTDGMFAEDVFADLTVPHWRLQAQGVDAAFYLREDNHPQLGKVRVEALDRTSRGFLIQLEERWEEDGQRWYCRELFHCVVTDGRISELVIYCTGDWDEAVQRSHAEQVQLVRP
jgi:hypothetical protein